MNLGKEEKKGEDDENENQMDAKIVKTCKGCLYYSSSLKSNSRNPRCFGIPRTSNQVPVIIVEQSEVETAEVPHFRYTCVGYSVFLGGKDLSADQQGTKIKMPACTGFEVVVVGRRLSTTEPAAASAPVHIRNKEEDDHEFSQPRTHKPAQSVGDDFRSRFTRNAHLVALGVAKNTRRVGNYIKENVDDILYPRGRRPK